MFKRMFVMLLLCGLVLGGVYGWKTFGKMMMMKHMAAMSNPPQTVSTTKITQQDWQNELRAVGSLRAAKGSDMAFEVAGTIDTLTFESGADVEEGAVLAQLRAEDDKAKLQSLEANLRLAELTVERDEKQLKANAISQATLDADMASRDSLKAQVAQQRATLDKKTLRAPFSGRLGIRQADIGQYINAGKVIVTLQQLDPLYLDFTLPQGALPQIKVGQKVQARTDAFGDKVFEGEISAIEAKIDESTRNFNVRATIANPDKSLRPGLFANASLSIGEPKRYLTLPQTAVTFNPYGNVVFVVKDKGTDAAGNSSKEAVTAFVNVVMRRGDQVAIDSGVAEGDEVVTAGQLKLRNGSPVIVNNTVEPSSDPAPKPQDK